MIIYSNNFSTDPNWTTDQPENFYWDSTTGTFIAITENAIPNYSPNRYAFEKINLDVSQSFSISWEYVILDADGYGISHFGLFDNSLLTGGSNVSTLNAGHGIWTDTKGPTQTYDLNIETTVFQTQGQSGISGDDRGGEIGSRYNVTLTYDANLSQVTYELANLSSGTIAIDLTRDINGVFLFDMTNIGIARDPFGSGSSVYALDPTDYQITAYDNIVVTGEPLTTINNPPIGGVYIDDITPEQGQVLTASNDLFDADGLGEISYLWIAGDHPVGLGETYTVTANDVGKTMTVKAFYTDGLDNLEIVSSSATEIITTTSKEIFEKVGLIPGDEGDDRTTGALEAGKIKVMADFSKAAYDLQEWEDKGDYDNELINDKKTYSDTAESELLTQGWRPVDLSPELVSPELYFYQEDKYLTLTNQMKDGFYTNANAAAFVARSQDSLVISFRGTNDMGKELKPDVGDWIDMPQHYAQFAPPYYQIRRVYCC